MKVQARVSFEGSTYMEVETDDYPHYFEGHPAKQGINQLLEDAFYDEADFPRGGPFAEGATEITNAYFDILGEEDHA